jgi:hypothetical protein
MRCCGASARPSTDDDLLEMLPQLLNGEVGIPEDSGKGAFADLSMERDDQGVPSALTL